MAKVRKLVKESGLSQQALGIKMGYPERSAKQSVWSFLQSENPTINVLVKFCKAMGTKVEELL